jgi:hypothetical protein
LIGSVAAAPLKARLRNLSASLVFFKDKPKED